MRRALAPFFLLAALSIHGQDPAALALLVNDTKVDPAVLAAGLKSSDALSRATTARVAMIRGAAELVPQLREALAAEANAEAAREEVRAVVILGSDDDVAFAAKQLRKFPASIDADFGEAVARLGAPRATTLYLAHGRGLRDVNPAVKHALWGRVAFASATAARLLGAKDTAGFSELLDAASESSLAFDSGIVVAALGSESPDIVKETIWYIVRTFAVAPDQMAESIRERATADRAGAPVEEAFGREVIRRMLGGKFTEKKEWQDWLKTSAGRARIPEGKVVRRHLTLDEQTALQDSEAFPQAAPDISTAGSARVRTSSFSIPIAMPNGLADALLKKMTCADAWLGVARATVDRAGRVQTLDLADVSTSGDCKTALQTLMRLTLAEPALMTSPLSADDLVVVKPRGDAVCFDEAPVGKGVARHGVLRVGGDVQPPVVLTRVEPLFPEGVRAQMKGPVVVVAEAVVTRSGCVREIRLVAQSPWPDLNASAILAIAQWKFKPGTLDGAPVDVVFNSTIRFSVR